MYLESMSQSLRLLDSCRFGTLRSELLYHTGRVESAEHVATELLRHCSGRDELKARLTYVLAMTAFERGQFGQSLEYINRSLFFSEAAGDPSLLATSQLGLLRLVADGHTGDVPLLADVRKVVARSGDPHLIVGLRLHFARAEASRHSPQESRRHLLAADDLLKRFPNLWLQGRVHLGLSVVDALSGDVRSSIEQAHLAIGCASKSGHSRTELGGLINLSHALQGIGGCAEARDCIRTVLNRAADDVEIRVAALDSLANLLMAEGSLSESGNIIREIDGLVAMMPPAVQSLWAQLTLRQTRIRLLQAEGAWTTADSELTNAIELAARHDDDSWQSRFRLLRLNGLVATKNFVAAAELLSPLELQPWTLDAFCQRTAVLGVANVASGQPRLGYEQLRRARRVSTALGNFSRDSDVAELRKALAIPEDPQTTCPHGSSALPAPDLDSAVALIELGSHPHILAREAAAVLEAAGCARAFAVTAGPANAPRVIESRGWDEREAAAAAKNSGTCDVIPLGQHRDEPWQLVVDPRPELDQRCTLIAIRKLIGTAVTLDRYRREEKQRAALWPAEALDGDPESIWASEQMSEVLSVARRIAPTPLSLLLTGETGTGKEMLARAIHRASDRADRTFLPFNCTAVPRDMLESQLFGYRKGAFTGADASFPGVIRSAAGGTLFLDEIADVAVDVQPKLLRFLETHEIHPLGEPHPVTVDVRVIAATNARLEQLVADGRFREDLFYRLNVVRLRLPPLRERREEIPPLVDHYLRKYGDEQKKGRLTLSDETLEYLLLYSWPGNLRELANEVRRMVAMAEPGAALTPALLSAEIRASRRTIPALPAVDPEVRVRIDQPLPAAVQLLEQTMVRSALDRSHGRVEEAARLLGISRKGLFLKRRRWGLHQAS